MSVNKQAATFGAGSFATARRAPVDAREIDRLHRLGRGAQTIATITGFSLEDVRRVLAPPPPVAANDDLEPWPFGQASGKVQRVVRGVAKAHGVSLAMLAGRHWGGNQSVHGKVWKAQRAAVAAVRESFPAMTWMDLEAIFKRDKKVLYAAVRRFAREQVQS